MMRREEFLKMHPDIKGDMIAYSSDGEKLGRITSLNQDTINIEKGFFFPRDFAVPYDNIVDVHGNEMIIDQRREALSSWQKEGYEAGYEERGRRSGPHTGELSRGEEIEIPLREEELQFIMDECRRVLRPGGVNLYSVRNDHDPHFRKGLHRGEDMWQSPAGFVVHFFTEEKVRRLARGYDVMRIREFDDPAKQYTRRLYEVLLRKPLTPPRR